MKFKLTKRLFDDDIYVAISVLKFNGLKGHPLTYSEYKYKLSTFYIRLCSNSSFWVN
jgi:hypothetical protein